MGALALHVPHGGNAAHQIVTHLRVKNWEQLYPGSKRLAYVKVYPSVLYDANITSMPLGARGLLFSFWAAASSSGGLISLGTPRELARYFKGTCPVRGAYSQALASVRAECSQRTYSYVRLLIDTDLLIEECLGSYVVRSTDKQEVQEEEHCDSTSRIAEAHFSLPTPEQLHEQRSSSEEATTSGRDETSSVVSDSPQSEPAKDILYGALSSRHNNDNNLAKPEEKSTPQGELAIVHTPETPQTPDRKRGVSAAGEASSPSTRQKVPGKVAASRKSSSGRATEPAPDELSDSAVGLAPPKKIPASWPAIAAEMFVHVAWHEPKKWGAALKPLVERHGVSRVLWVVASYAGSGMRDIDAGRYTPHRLAAEWGTHAPDWNHVGLADPATPFDMASHHPFVRERILDCRPELIHAIARLSDAQREARSNAAAAQIPVAPAIGGVLS